MVWPSSKLRDVPVADENYHTAVVAVPFNTLPECHLSKNDLTIQTKWPCSRLAYLFGRSFWFVEKDGYAW